MIKLLIALAFVSDYYTIARYRPVHVLSTEGRSCGASERLLKEKVKLAFAKDFIKVNGVEWKFEDDVLNGHPVLLEKAGIEHWNWGWAATYQVRADQYMSMSLLFNEEEAYLSIQGIDEKRKPCMDAVYLRRVR